MREDFLCHGVCGLIVAFRVVCLRMCRGSWELAVRNVGDGVAEFPYCVCGPVEGVVPSRCSGSVSGEGLRSLIVCMWLTNSRGRKLWCGIGFHWRRDRPVQNRSAHVHIERKVLSNSMCRLRDLHCLNFWSSA